MPCVVGPSFKVQAKVVNGLLYEIIEHLNS